MSMRSILLAAPRRRRGWGWARVAVAAIPAQASLQHAHVAALTAYAHLRFVPLDHGQPASSAVGYGVRLRQPSVNPLLCAPDVAGKSSTLKASRAASRPS